MVKKTAKTEKIISELRSVKKLTNPNLRTSWCTPSTLNFLSEDSGGVGSIMAVLGAWGCGSRQRYIRLYVNALRKSTPEVKSLMQCFFSGLQLQCMWVSTIEIDNSGDYSVISLT